MRTTGIKRGDIVQVDIKGDRFFAVVKGPASSLGSQRSLAVRSICRPAIARNVTARQITSHYARRKG